MLIRLISFCLVWGIGTCIGWAVAFEYATVISAKLRLVLHALNGLY